MKTIFYICLKHVLLEVVKEVVKIRNSCRNETKLAVLAIRLPLIYRGSYVLNITHSNRNPPSSHLYFLQVLYMCFKAVKTLTTHFIHFDQSRTLCLLLKHSQSSNFCRFQKINPRFLLCKEPSSRRNSKSSLSLDPFLSNSSTQSSLIAP